MNPTCYRNDITGLRALAVLSVLIFHIFPSFLVGGYLGVDMFFVISGYLITLTLITEKKLTGSVSLIKFYKRRIFRIAPATIFTILITLLLANTFMNFEDLAKTSKSAIFSVFGLANIYFYKFLDTSYFADNVALKPLLHLWSLGVEEQFYFAFPLLFIFLSKYKKLFFILLAIISIVSVVWASIIVKTNPMFAYYMLPTRSFGLILGCLSALYCSYYYKNTNNTIANILSVSSIILIIIGFIVLSSKYNLPNYLSLIVVIPTALLIIIGYKNQTFIHKILGCNYLKHIGLWSFSIYLVHWVILSFYKYINGITISFTVGISIIIASILLGGFSYYLVEQPLRFKRWNIAFAIFIFILTPFIITQANYYYAQRGGIKYATITPKWPIDEYTCKQSTKEYVTNNNDLFKAKCTHNAKAEPNVILWGDSNSYHYIPALNIIAKKVGFGFRNMSHSACPALTTKNKENYIAQDNNMEGACDYNSNKAYQLSKHYDIIILSNSWVNIYNKSNETILRKELDKTLNDLSKTSKLILVLGNIPIPDNLDLNNILTQSKINNNKNNLDGKLNKIIFNVINPAIKQVVSNYPNAYYVDFNNILCNNISCQYSENKNSFYMNDGSHLSVYGSKYIGNYYINGNINNVFYKIKNLYKESSLDTFIKNTNKILNQATLEIEKIENNAK